MKVRSNRKSFIVTAAIVLCLGCVAFYLIGGFDYIPRVRAKSTNTDGSLTAVVYQKRLSPRPFFPRMGAIARVYDRNGKLLFDKVIYADDDWDDTLGDGYRQIDFTVDEIHISPAAYRDQTYVIKMSELAVADEK